MFHRALLSVSTIGLSLLSLSIASAYAAETYTLDTPRLTGIDNFRDLAGTTTAYTTSNDGVMRSGVFYRSNALTPKGTDLAVLNSLGISNVYDLRTPSEIAGTPDTLPAGAAYQNIDIIGSTTSGANVTNISFTSAAQAVEMMEETNRAFVSDAGMRGQFTTLFNELAAADGAALFHCTAGKDRTGWTAAVLLSIAGVDSATIMENYLATNDYTAARVKATLAMLPASMAAIYEPLLGVQASYLQAGLDEVTAEYGTMDNYLKEGLGLSQETIYVLRGKMVYYSSLPGTAGLSGNAAAGAQLLTQLQNSSLSGDYTAYNYYLQSAIDAGTLGGVESTVGGQVHADAASYLLRQDALIDKAAAPYASGVDLKAGQTRLWTTALAGYQGNSATSNAQSSNEHTQGMMIGVTQRFSDQLSGNAGFGYSKGSVGGAGGDVDTDLTFVRGGARFALDSLEQGLFVDADLSYGWLDYDSKRDIGGGLGKAKGDTNGSLSGGSLALGYRTAVSTVTLEPSIGLRYSHLDLDGFQEKGSELALDVDDISENRRSAYANLKASFAAAELGGGWQMVPALEVGYDHALGDYKVDSEGQLLGLDISQRAAFDNRDQFSGAFSLTASQGDFSIGAEVGALGGSGSHGASGSLKASYQF
ncbi:tyrosine-protein phosphatase [Pseudomonas nicosulfuronedens]|uniref:tyrosine-protein phosphatase n=1 Tax=Pseudomonas nicosulfuronedens TaxID=2571105 RepID=UPI001FE7B907|nr:tyrosine-protein phosphatase [Pseudomonas nicosulfuronedens]MDH1011031.1 tyrosine-protein phosphatase [Pseudomonas nicosulfuronedens]MDH1979554.1 tyrosine-protein phosphatase [Pseudomonas nicosulfuronedens]MDH2026801.1 tyrosine-protein phosphatase [Pseudomonas nicosulfuronedens]